MYHSQNSQSSNTISGQSTQDSGYAGDNSNNNNLPNQPQKFQYHLLQEAKIEAQSSPRSYTTLPANTNTNLNGPSYYQINSTNPQNLPHPLKVEPLFSPTMSSVQYDNSYHSPIPGNCSLPNSSIHSTSNLINNHNFSFEPMMSTPENNGLLSYIVPESQKSSNFTNVARNSTKSKKSNSKRSSVSSNTPTTIVQNENITNDTNSIVVSKKPPYSYKVLIQMAINSTKNNTMPLKDIYKWIEDNYPWYKTSKSAWKNSVRHNLSLHSDMFIKVDNENLSTWRLADSIYRRNYPTPKKRRSAVLTATNSVSKAYGNSPVMMKSQSASELLGSSSTKTKWSTVNTSDLSHSVSSTTGTIISEVSSPNGSLNTLNDSVKNNPLHINAIRRDPKIIINRKIRSKTPIKANSLIQIKNQEEINQNNSELNNINSNDENYPPPNTEKLKETKGDQFIYYPIKLTPIKNIDIPEDQKKCDDLVQSCIENSENYSPVMMRDRILQGSLIKNLDNRDNKNLSSTPNKAIKVKRNILSDITAKSSSHNKKQPLMMMVCRNENRSMTKPNSRKNYLEILNDSNYDSRFLDISSSTNCDDESSECSPVKCQVGGMVGVFS